MQGLTPSRSLPGTADLGDMGNEYGFALLIMGVIVVAAERLPQRASKLESIQHGGAGRVVVSTGGKEVRYGVCSRQTGFMRVGGHPLGTPGDS